jgi:ATP-dependent DNA helicase DinG
VAGDHLGLSLTSGQFEYLFNKLYNDRSQRGLLVHHRWTDCQQLVDECRIRADEFFFDVQQYLDKHGRSNGRIEQPPVLDNLLSPALERAANLIRRRANDLPPETKAECVSASDKLTLLASEVRSWLDQKEAGSVFWVDVQEGRRRRVSLAAAPIDIGPALRTMLFETVPTVILTSATLSVGKNNFDFFKSRIGLTQADTLKLGSPFDYRRQARIVLPLGMPDPTADARTYERKACEMIRRYVEQTDGRAFVLFTSYQMLRSTAAALTPWLAERNLALYSQADGLPRTQMLEKFKANPRSVLFGTDSFWQGVDVPGDALTNVIITKLPFSVPDRPLLEARLDQIRENGGNPFRDYQLPEAVLKLKQGFGRLIRTKDDMGQVVILDPRILTKPYGKTFLESLPDCELIRERAGEEASRAPVRPVREAD